MENKAVGLARPVAVQLAAAVLIMIPVMDIASAQRSGGYMFGVITWIMVAGAGASLMIRHKSAWVLGIVLCSGFIGMSLFDLLFASTVGMDPMVTTMKFMDCLLVGFVVATVFYFFRYPYLDRRQNWLAPTGDRFKVQMPVKINGKFASNTVDLSYTGARIAVDQEMAGVFKAGDRVSLQLSEVNDTLCQARVVDVQKDWIRVHFEDTSAEEKELVRQWLLSQNLQKV